MTPEKDGQLEIDLDDQVVRGTVVSYRGEKMWPPPKVEEPSPSPPAVRQAKDSAGTDVASVDSSGHQLVPVFAAVAGF